MNKALTAIAAAAALTGASAVSTASSHYEPVISEQEINRTIYNLPEGAEIERLPTRLNICGETANIIMNEYGYQIWCGQYAFMAPSFGGNACLGHTLERRMPLTNIVDKWSDLDCDGIIELYTSEHEGISASYSDYTIIQMIENMGLNVEGSMVENAARFFEEAHIYNLLLFDMNKKKADELWNNYRARNLTEGEPESITPQQAGGA